MSLSSIFYNIAGTLKNTFRIGKDGPTLRQGKTDPNSANVVGVDGDVYILHDTEDHFFQRRNGSWINIGGEGFTRTVVTTATYTVKPTDYYIGVNRSGPVTINLPAGLKNKTYLIKDESGMANMNDNPITVNPDGLETIDGESEMIIVAPYTSLTLVFGGEWHLI